MIRAILYARVSYDDRRNQDRNLEGQLEDGRAYCQERGYQIVAELAEDDRGASGADWDLPKLNEALEMARRGEADVLVTRELDRLARSLAKQLVIESEFKRYGVRTEYVMGEYPDTPEGQLLKNTKAVIAEYFREDAKIKLTRGRRNVVRSGKLMLHGDRPPYGYRVEDGRLVIYEPEARIVRLIFDWYVNGDGDRRLSSRPIADRLTEMRVPTWADVHGLTTKAKRGYGEWSWRQVMNILTNETYRGLWHYGKRNCFKGVVNNPREHWLTLEIPAIIDSDLWEKAQEQRKLNTSLAKRNVKNEYLVGRRVRCGCGSGMCGYSTTVRGVLYRYYRCNAYMGGVAGVKCDLPSFRVDQVDGAVWEWVKGWLSNPEALKQGLEAQQTQQEQANKPLHDRLAVIDELIVENRRQLAKLLDLYLAGDFDREMLTDRKTRLETTLAALEKEKGDLVAFLESQLSDEKIVTLTEFAQEISEGLEMAETDFEAKRQIIDLLDVRVTLTVEDRQKVAYVRCLIDNAVLPIVCSTSRCRFRPISH